MEISTYNLSTKRSLNLAPFDKISKSGDGGGSGGSLDTKGVAITMLTLSTETLANIER